MRSCRCYVPVVVWILNLVMTLPASAFDIALSGRARVAIVTGENPTPVVSEMSTELTNYLHKITGANFKISERPVAGLKSIRLGTTYAGKPEEGTFFINRKNELEITGTPPRGTVYATYRFLKHLGVRFWAPDQETVPENKNLRVSDSLRVVSAPAFEYRDASGEASYKAKWCAKAGLNKAHGRIPDELGGDNPQDFNQGMCRQILDNRKHFKDHPEWYALWPDKGPTYRSQWAPCWSNPETLAQIVKDCGELLRKDPRRTSVSISNPDVGTYCRCEECKNARVPLGSAPSVNQLLAANHVARELSKEFPNVRVYALMYYITGWIPDIAVQKIKLEPNVWLCFAELGRDAGKPLRGQPLAGKLKNFAKISEGRFYIWDYYAMFHDFLIPHPDLDVLEDNIRWYRELGVKGLMAQLTWGSLGEFGDLRSWLLAELLWDPDQDGKKLIGEWIDGTCGAGAPFIRKYWDVQYGARDRAKAKIGVYGSPIGDWFTAEDMVESYILFQKALEATKGDEPAHGRVEKLYASILDEAARRYYIRKCEEVAAKRNLKWPTKDELIDELDRIGKKHKCSCTREWADFGSLIKDLKAIKEIR